MEPSKKIEQVEAGQADARIEELHNYYLCVRQALERMMSALGPADGDKPAAVVAQLAELHAAHLEIAAIKKALDHENPEAASDADIAELRANIGRKLDRIRATISPENIPAGPKF